MTFKCWRPWNYYQMLAFCCDIFLLQVCRAARTKIHTNTPEINFQLAAYLSTSNLTAYFTKENAIFSPAADHAVTCKICCQYFFCCSIFSNEKPETVASELIKINSLWRFIDICLFGFFFLSFRYFDDDDKDGISA